MSERAVAGLNLRAPARERKDDPEGEGPFWDGWVTTDSARLFPLQDGGRGGVEGTYGRLVVLFEALCWSYALAPESELVAGASFWLFRGLHLLVVALAKT